MSSYEYWEPPSNAKASRPYAVVVFNAGNCGGCEIEIMSFFYPFQSIRPFWGGLDLTQLLAQNEKVWSVSALQWNHIRLPIQEFISEHIEAKRKAMGLKR